MDNTFENQVNVSKKIEEMKEELLPHQFEALKHIGWLLYGARATGRTHLMCVVTIMTAVENIGVPIKIHDHFPELHVIREFVFDYLYRMLERYEILQYFKINRNSKTITYDPIRVVMEKK